MQLLFGPGRAHEFHLGRILHPFAIPIESDDRPRAVVDLLLVTMGGILDLAALVTFLDGRQHAAEPFDFAKFIQNRRFHCALDRFHAWRPAQHVHGVFKNTRLFQEDGLCVRGEPDPFFARRGEWLVGAIGMAGVGGVHVRENQLRRRAGEVVLELGGNQRATAGLRMQFEKLRLRPGAEHVAHADGPNATGNPRQRYVFGIQPAIEKERQPRPELIHRYPARGEHLHVGKAVRKRVSGLLHRSGTGFANVITADGDGVPARHLARGVFDHVGQKSQRRIDGEDGFILRLDFLQNVGLNGPAQFGNHTRPEPAFGRGDVHGHDDRRRAADGHGRGKIRRTKVKPVVEPHHVFHRVDGHAAFADFSENAVRIAVQPVKGGAIKRRAQAMGALVAREIVKALVRVLGQHQAGEQTRGLFGLRNFPVVFAAVFLETFNLPDRLEIHLAIGGVEVRKFAR